MAIENLVTLNAFLNSISSIMLIMGFINIKKGNKVSHKKFMISALIISAIFLISYVIYHYYVGSVPYPYHDWTRPIYFGILIPHIILAGLNVPFIAVLVYFAFKEKYINHKRLARWVWPVWMFVSLSGVTIYFMNYIL